MIIYKKYFIYCLLLLPTTVFSTSCDPTSIADYLLDKSNIIVSFKVMDIQMSNDLTTHVFSENYI